MPTDVAPSGDVPLVGCRSGKGWNPLWGPGGPPPANPSGTNSEIGSESSLSYLNPRFANFFPGLAGKKFGSGPQSRR